MTATSEIDGYSVQTSVRFGPSNEAMVVVRSPDFATNAGHWAEGAAFASQIHGHITEFLALGNVMPNFPATAPVTTAPVAPAVNQSTATPSAPRGEVKPCPLTAGKLHNVRRGVKNGKPWAGWFCSADACAVEWIDG